MKYIQYGWIITFIICTLERCNYQARSGFNCVTKITRPWVLVKASSIITLSVEGHNTVAHTLTVKWGSFHLLLMKLIGQTIITHRRFLWILYIYNWVACLRVCIGPLMSQKLVYYPFCVREREREKAHSLMHDH